MTDSPIDSITTQNSSIAILMATCDGEKYLAEQINSLLAQTCLDWHLFIHDDGSTDGTMAIVRSYIDKYSEKITLLDYPAQGGACHNFLSLLERVEAPYYMFCDQDDVWTSSKVEKELSVMKELEKQHGLLPVIVNSDLTVVDANLHTIHPSFWQYRGIFPDFVRRFQDFSATNVATGCTMLFNRRAKEVIQTPYTHIMMHDAWITLCVFVNNGILYNMNTPTVLYRQHGDNTIGAFDVKKLTLRYRLRHFREMATIFYRQFRQMNAISHVSLFTYIWTKILYKRYISLQSKNHL